MEDVLKLDILRFFISQDNVIICKKYSNNNGKNKRKVEKNVQGELNECKKEFTE